jgi:hypothetical protein
LKKAALLFDEQLLKQSIVLEPAQLDSILVLEEAKQFWIGLFEDQKPLVLYISLSIGKCIMSF